jgi:hypothetical protein
MPNKQVSKRNASSEQSKHPRACPRATRGKKASSGSAGTSEGEIVQAAAATPGENRQLAMRMAELALLDRSAPESVQFCEAMRIVGLGPGDIALGLANALIDMDKARFDSYKDAARLLESFVKLGEKQASAAPTMVQLVHSVARPVRALPPPAILEPAPPEDSSDTDDDPEPPAAT